ncbi:tRNA (adenosine(37)-N6)-threonylcarbamoyltransferase complex dimerization subunit type 1 TsaB [Colwellia sp. Bg11-28]|uniref:tRNA (adenosine(37)-N6)-threonylcarbamoyltransferase complex dimerization subunit type 1 TsaB n=1 Tax=Colwellia sp. Bg11-28 TaxID=2058305 RepID=UPI000C3245A0|nr:tRNA (adenosine(37)-N6)-threonylcarbamoyltransferase complex dimerization subunit type 1 TsaB [Colwellia sp. Bg11-28]PKH89307.1 tRNA (adenosine(37)-N6)-threonylcarbamoyltransferase complex dimerization subunit type 1 TsaB [Colwellia sp. Bg11-28]
MNYLALDASTEACSVALQVNGKTFSRYELCPQSHSLHLLPMIDAVLHEAGIKLAELDGLIFGQGPGSFTGVRIGVGVAQGLAFSANLPVVGVSSLQAMAQLAYIKHGQKQVLAAIDARMSEVYNGYFVLDENNVMQAQKGEAVTPPENLAQQLSDVVVAPFYAVGTGWDAYPEKLSEKSGEQLLALKINEGSPDILFPSAEAMLAIGKVKLELGQGVSAEHAQPVYVRDTVSWQKLPGK